MPQASTARPGVGDFVRQLRQRDNRSQRTLSASVGRSCAYINKLEAGSIDPSLRAFASIAVALRMTAMEIWTIVQVEAQAQAEENQRALPVTPPLYPVTHSTVGGGNHE